MAVQPFSNFSFRKSFILLGLTWCALHAYTLISLNIEMQLAIKDGVISTFITALLCYLVSTTLGYYQPGKSKFSILIAWCLFLAFINTSTITLVLSHLIYDSDYPTFLADSLPIRFAVSFLLIGAMSLVSTLWYSQQDKAQNERRKIEAEKLSREAALTALREQLQPHFLFNSLNSISALVVSQPAQARKMIFQLSDFLRGTIRQDDQPTALKMELEHLQLYLDIEQVRFGHRLSTRINSEEACQETLIPPMILQPLVENAIKFGLYDTIEQITITIDCSIKDQMLKISVKNPFDPSTAVPQKGTGFGLSSVKKRLQLFYNRYDLLQVRTENNEFIATINIPQI